MYRWMPAIGVFIYELSDRLLFLTVLPCLLKAGTGIAELIALEMSKQVLISPSVCFSLSSAKLPDYLLFSSQTKAPPEETRKKIWLVDSKVIET